MAVKYLGNVGSHLDDISRDDVYDALDIVDLVLDDLFLRHHEQAIILVREINARKGPTKR